MTVLAGSYGQKYSSWLFTLKGVMWIFLWGLFVQTNVLLTKTYGVSNGGLASTEYISFPVKPCSILYCVLALFHISWCDTTTCRLVDWCKTSRKMLHVMDAQYLCPKYLVSLWFRQFDHYWLSPSAAENQINLILCQCISPLSLQCILQNNRLLHCN